MSRRNPDWIDLICNDWAREKRKYLGIILPEKLEPRERLGKLRSTLASLITDGPGASHGTAGQSYPEVFRGDSILVNQWWAKMPQGLHKRIILTHYVWREIPVTVIAEEMGVDVKTYYDSLETAKQRLDGHLRAHGISNDAEV